MADNFVSASKPIYTYRSYAPVVGIGSERSYVDVPVFDCGFGESFVDTTNWRPDSEQVRARMLSPQGGSQSVGVFDFPDGKDTGVRPFRDLGADITEIDEAIERVKNGDMDAKRRKEELDATKSLLADSFREALGTAVSDDGSPSE